MAADLVRISLPREVICQILISSKIIICVVQLLFILTKFIVLRRSGTTTRSRNHTKVALGHISHHWTG